MFFCFPPLTHIDNFSFLGGGGGFCDLAHKLSSVCYHCCLHSPLYSFLQLQVKIVAPDTQFEALTIVGKGERKHWVVDERGTAVEVVGAGSLRLDASTIKGENVDAVRVVGSGSKLSAKGSSALRAHGGYSKALMVCDGGMAVLEQQCTVRDGHHYGVYMVPTAATEGTGRMSPFVSTPVAFVRQR